MCPFFKSTNSWIYVTSIKATFKPFKQIKWWLRLAWNRKVCDFRIHVYPWKTVNPQFKGFYLHSLSMHTNMWTISESLAIFIFLKYCENDCNDGVGSSRHYILLFQTKCFVVFFLECTRSKYCSFKCWIKKKIFLRRVIPKFRDCKGRKNLI